MALVRIDTPFIQEKMKKKRKEETNIYCEDDTYCHNSIAYILLEINYESWRNESTKQDHWSHN